MNKGGLAAWFITLFLSLSLDNVIIFTFFLFSSVGETGWKSVFHFKEPNAQFETSPPPPSIRPINFQILNVFIFWMFHLFSSCTRPNLKLSFFFFCLWQGKNISAWTVLYPVTGSPTWSSPLAVSLQVEGDQILWNCCQLMIYWFIYLFSLWIQISLHLTVIFFSNKTL